MDSILRFEEGTQRFEESSRAKYPDELKTAALLRCSRAKLKEHPQFSLDEKATYAQVKEQILNFEGPSKSWSHETNLKPIHHANKRHSDGPTSTEVDRIEDKSKGKGKKSKEKGGILVAVLVDEVVESQKVSARKVVVEAKTKEASRRARKERPKMDRKAKRQVPINAKFVLAMVNGVETAHNVWM